MRSIQTLLPILLCGSTMGCGKESQTKPKADTAAVAPAPAAPPAPEKPKPSTENLKLLLGEWKETYNKGLDYWTVSKRTTKLSRDPSGFYGYAMTIRLARPDVPSTAAELEAKALAGELEQASKFFAVDKVDVVPGGFAVIGLRGDKNADVAKANKEFFVVRDAGGGVRIACTPGSSNPGSNDEIIAEAVALCASATL